MALRVLRVQQGLPGQRALELRDLSDQQEIMELTVLPGQPVLTVLRELPAQRVHPVPMEQMV